MAKRIQSACLQQTIRFETPAEFAEYKSKLERKRVQFVTDDMQVQPDGSVIVQVRRQYNNYSVQEYLK